MNRRRFLAASAAAGLSAAASWPEEGRASDTAPPWERDVDPAGGYTPEPAREFLFTDYRHVDPGDLSWTTADGKALPVADPPPPPVEAVANARGVAQGVHLLAQKAVKQGPLEGLAGGITYDGEHYRSWNLGVSYGEGKDLGSYSLAPAKSMSVSAGESRDGYEWKWSPPRPVRAPEVTGVDGGYFFIDPAGPPEERYKCVFNARMLSGQEGLWQRYQQVHPRHRDVRLNAKWMYCLFGLVSADGRDWKLLAEPLMIHMGDTDNTVYYDRWLGKYVLYTRLYWMQRRLVARAESDDFRHWTPVEPIIWPRLEDPLSWDVYTNGRTSYPGLAEHHLMFPTFYRRLTQDAETHLHSSLDGIHWLRVPGGPVLESGAPAAWDSGFLVAGKNMVPLGPDRVAITYAAADHPHKYPRWPGVIAHKAGYAVWPRGRLAALTAPGEGSFRTFALKVTGSRLKLNVRTARAGEVRVGLSGAKGRAVSDCDPVVGDHLSHTVTWKSNPEPALEPGAGVTLSFQMRAAELFGFEWAGG